VINELNDNIIRDDFIHTHKLTYVAHSRQVKFAGAYANYIAAIKQTILPAMTSTVVNTKYKEKAYPKATNIANICAPRMPMVLGMPAIVSINEFNNCKIVVKNCAPYDLTLERDDILGIIEIEEEELVLLKNDFILSVCQDIYMTASQK
jgi:hypothetical protein